MLVRELGLALPIGSILTYVVMNAVVASSVDAKLVYNQRLFVSAISRTLTIPGVWMLAGTDVATLLAARRLRSENEWLIGKLCLSTLLALNTTLIIAPLASRVTAIAKLGDEQGSLPDSYAPLKTLEDRCGMVNVLLLTAALLAGIVES